MLKFFKVSNELEYKITTNILMSHGFKWLGSPLNYRYHVMTVNSEIFHIGINKDDLRMWVVGRYISVVAPIEDSKKYIKRQNKFKKNIHYCY